jgi:hypothetical protein
VSVHVGGYPTYGAPDTDLARAVVEGLAASPVVRGLELPIVDGEVWLPPGARVPGEWCHVCTTIPATMAALEKDALYGLASTDASGREAALGQLRSVREGVVRRSDVLAVEIHSAPTRTGSAAVFQDSLYEVAGWDWAGVELVVEHCDAWTTEHPVQKGFLSFADELAAVKAVQGGATRVTAGVNWARSVIETRDPATGADHAREAARQGLLGAVMFSSVGDRESALGDAWRDVHLAPAGTLGAPEGSLLTAELITETVAAAGPSDPILGVKISLTPLGLDPATIVDRLLAIAALVPS